MCATVKGDALTVKEEEDQSWPCFPPKPPPSRISQSQVLIVGTMVFILANIWPPLILVVTFILSRFIPYAFRINDDALARRQLWKKFEKMKHTPIEFREPSKDIVLEEQYWANSRGMCLMTSTIIPKDKKILGVVCFCHGYIDNASFLKRVEYQRLVREGFALVTIEYEGHGRSDGPNGLINSLDQVVRDAAEFFHEITQKKFPGKKCFLMGESMGGAIAFENYKLNPSRWSGVVFVAPMCKVADDMLPPEWVVKGFQWLLGPAGSKTSLGILPAAPSKGDVSKLSHRLEEKRLIATSVPSAYGRVPRLGTAREVLHMTTKISSSLKDFDAPFLVLHGEADRVTCPKLSQALYDESKSKDKEIKLYKDMWHAITVGEPDDKIESLFKDVAKWLKDRV